MSDAARSLFQGRPTAANAPCEAGTHPDRRDRAGRRSSDSDMPIAAADPILRLFSDDPALSATTGIALLVAGILLLRGFLVTVSDLAVAAAAWRRTPPDSRTMTIAEVQRTGDYRAATADERAVLDRIDPAAELVRETDFEQHSAAVARDIVGEDRCPMWPYRHVNLEEAADDLRTSYRSINLGPATYWFHP